MHAAAGVAVRLGEVGDIIVLGADLHACRNPETGEVAPWAREVTSVSRPARKCRRAAPAFTLFFAYP